jgi:hypothetical protein
VVNEFFDAIKSEPLRLDIDDDQKRSVIQYCGRKYTRGGQTLLLFQFRELEKLTSLALS